MYKILLVTHGELGKGLKNTLGMFTSETDHVHYVSLDESGVENFRNALVSKVEEIYVEGEEILVLADLFGGTPFNTATVEVKAKYQGVEIIAGVNLPMLIEAALMKDMSINDIVDTLIDGGASSVKKFEMPQISLDEDDE